MEQDSRFPDKTELQRRKLKFPQEYQTKIELSKIRLSDIHSWIRNALIDLMDGVDDEVVQNLVIGSVDAERPLDPAGLQIMLASWCGMERSAAFVKHLWQLLISAHSSPLGIPAAKVLTKPFEFGKVRTKGNTIIILLLLCERSLGRFHCNLNRTQGNSD